MARVLMIIAPEGFRDEELFVTREQLEKAGHTITVASTRAGRCLGSLGGSAAASLSIADVKTADYDAVAFIGGRGVIEFYSLPEAWRIAREMHARNAVVAAICLAPVILANAGILKDRDATVSSSESRTIESGGARYTGMAVTADGNIVTGNGPKSARLFGEKINEVLRKRQPVVSLQAITSETVIAICKLSDTLSPAQQEMVAPNAISIAQAHFNPRLWFRAIYVDEDPAGFLMLYSDPEQPQYFLWRLMIAGPSQGFGYGARAMQLLIEYVKRQPGATELLVSCGQGEASPEAFYIGLGFRRTGEMAGDEVVLSLPL